MRLFIHHVSRPAGQRPPGRLPDIALLSGELLPGSAIAGDRGQYPPPAHFGSVENHLAVRRKGWGFVEPGVGEKLDLPGCHILYGDIEAITAAVNKGKTFAVRAVVRTNVVTSLK